MLPHCNRGKKTIFGADFPGLLYAGNSNFLLNVRISVRIPQRHLPAGNSHFLPTVRNSCRNTFSNPICVIPVLGYSAWCHQRHPRVFPSVHPGLVSSGCSWVGCHQRHPQSVSIGSSRLGIIRAFPGEACPKSISFCDFTPSKASQEADYTSKFGLFGQAGWCHQRHPQHGSSVKS